MPIQSLSPKRTDNIGEILSGREKAMRDYLEACLRRIQKNRLPIKKRGANEIILKILIDLINAITELIMVLLRASFKVAMGMCAVVMILMLVIMIAYIIKVCIEEIRK